MFFKQCDEKITRVRIEFAFSIGDGEFPTLLNKLYWLARAFFFPTVAVSCVEADSRGALRVE